jgi:hypothetical protein
MVKEDIIFFDALGFGWIVDTETIRKISPANPDEDWVSERRLFDCVYRGSPELAR